MHNIIVSFVVSLWHFLIQIGANGIIIFQIIIFISLRRFQMLYLIFTLKNKNKYNDFGIIL